MEVRVKELGILGIVFELGRVGLEFYWLKEWGCGGDSIYKDKILKECGLVE